MTLINKIDEILPQTQCTKCGFPSCKEYATAIAANKANINQCPPGGNKNIIKLAKITNKQYTPLNQNHGKEGPKQIAYINEDECIGCTLCIKACPVDAIVGSSKMIHTVIKNDCTGCDLCVPVCPVDCIELVEDKEPWTKERQKRAKKTVYC